MKGFLRGRTTGTIGFVKQQDTERVGGIGQSEAKTPMDRARQIQEMQRQMDAQQVPQQAQEVHTPAQAAPAAQVQQQHAVFEAQAVAKINIPKSNEANPAEQALYGKAQADVGALFGGKNEDIEVVGNPWKIIPFGDVVPNLVDLKKPATEYRTNVPMQAVKLKEGLLFNMVVTPKAAGSEPAVKKAILVDEKGGLKGADFGGKEALKKGLENIPTFAMGLFSAVFGEGVAKAEPRHLRVASVEVGKKSSYEVKLERKNEISGAWDSRVLTLNNFGLRVPPSETNPNRYDLIVGNYHLDRFGP